MSENHAEFVMPLHVSGGHVRKENRPTFSPNVSLSRKEQFFAPFLKSDFAFPLEMTNSEICQPFCLLKICFVIPTAASLPSKVSFRKQTRTLGVSGSFPCCCLNPATRGHVSFSPAVPGRGLGTTHGFWLLLALQARVQKQRVQIGVLRKTGVEGCRPERMP